MTMMLTRTSALLVVAITAAAATASNSINSQRIRRRLQDAQTTCLSSTPNGYDAFDVAAEDTFIARDVMGRVCHFKTEAQDGAWQEASDIHHSLQETTFLEICEDSEYRYLFSNGVPDHSIWQTSERPQFCIVRYAVQVPLNPSYVADYLEELPISGPVAFSVNTGIPFVDVTWAVSNQFLFGDENIVSKGHANERSHYWHYHSSLMNPDEGYPLPTTQVGIAMDGFPIYGPLSVDSTETLDGCNGIFDETTNQYQYHMRRMDDIDFTLPQCNSQDKRIHNWKPIMGCFHGSTSNSRVWVDDGNREGMTCTTIKDGHYENTMDVEQDDDIQNEKQFIDCLQAIEGAVTVAGSGDGGINTISTDAAAQCHNSLRTDRKFAREIKAVIKVSTVEQVAAAVKCAASHNIKVTPRSGAHGFENEACSGELILDVSGLEELEVVSMESKVVKFGAGHLHGQLYKKLSEQYGWVVPGGTENSVGTAGLWLGCGRGPLSQIYGLSCDNILGAEFVDAQGIIRNANAQENADMYWMARGSGGEFPGIVTAFTVQAYDQPTDVFIIKNGFLPPMVPALVKEWTQRLDDLSNPSRNLFVALTSHNSIMIMSMTCFSCSEDQKAYMKLQFDEITAIAGKAQGVDYVYWGGTWMDRLLMEDWDGYETTEDLAVKPEWPEVWSILSNGGHLVYPDDEVSDSMLSIMQNALEKYGNNFHFFFYSMNSSASSNTLIDTPYGGRDAKWILHYKWIGEDTSVVKANLRDLSIAFDNTGLQCKNFYNYADREYPCAGSSGEAWLEAHFSNVPRMRQIREAEDPSGLFVSNFKLQKWDSNEHEFLGYPQVGDWGGTCTCPNGSVYQVGDNNDSCETLACIGGSIGTCSGINPGGAGFKVVCDTSFTPSPTPKPPVQAPSAAPVKSPTPVGTAPSPDPATMSPTENGGVPATSAPDNVVPTLPPATTPSTTSAPIPLSGDEIENNASIDDTRSSVSSTSSMRRPVAMIVAAATCISIYLWS